MLDPDSVAFVLSGVSISLAAAGPDRLPCMSRGLGCKVLDGGRRIAVFVKRSQSAELLANVAATARVANVFSLPSDNVTLQLKGDDARVEPFDPADLAIVGRHIDDFVEQVLPLGTPEEIVRAIFAHSADDLVAVIYSPSDAYLQTPGPRAGEPFGGPR